MGAEDEKIFIVGVHSGWLREFTSMYGGPHFDEYKKICKVVGDEKKLDEGKFNLGNGDMIDYTIEVEGDKIKIAGMKAYDLQGIHPKQKDKVDPSTHAVDVSAVTLARFESFGDYDDYYYDDDYDEEYYDDEDDAYYYDLLNYVLSLIK